MKCGSLIDKSIAESSNRYPFHLRPNNRQALQYIRMAADIVRDLDLDQPAEEDIAQIRSNPDRVAGIRAYLACYYLSTQ